ncbi:MAG: CDP-glycerol glycerophosphotransferase family protein [Anaerovoracaceae bacterium]|jgi:CDP-glycerol glycerophosphotransferase (TagB/SpsB family)
MRGKLRKARNRYRKFSRRAEFTRYMTQLPVMPDTVFYHAYRTRIMAGNPFAIFRELTEREEFRHFQHYWVYADEKSLENDTFRRYRDDPRVHFVRALSSEHLRAMATCRYIVNNAAMPDFWQKRPDQIYINTWHGTPLKMLGKFAKDASRSAISNAQRNFLLCDYLVMPNRYTAEQMLRSYDIEHMLTGKILDAGYPRNDLTLNTDPRRIRGLLEKKLGTSLADRKIVLYAPTFRSRDGKSLDTSVQAAGYIEEMIEKFPDDYVVFFKVHNTLGAFFEDSPIADRLIFDEIETNELLSAVDVLITDYSSIFFDFLCTGRPCLFFVYDREEYEAGRGLYLDVETLPGALCESIDQLVGCIGDIDAGTYDAGEKHRAYVRRFAYHDDGCAAQRVVDIVFRNREGMEQYILESAPTGKEQVLINAGRADRLSIVLILEELLRELDPEKYQITIATGNAAAIRSRCEAINPDVRLLSSTMVFNRTKAEAARGAIDAERQREKYFGDLRFDLFVDLTDGSGNCSVLFRALGGVRRYAALVSGRAAERFIAAYRESCEKIFVIGGRPEKSADETVVRISRTEFLKRSPAHLNVLILSAFDSMNYVFTECIRELEKRGHRAVVLVLDENDEINNKMYISHSIAFLSAGKFDTEALELIDLAAAAPTAQLEYDRIQREINRRNVFLCSFANLFSSILMRTNADVVFCIGENKCREFDRYGLRYNCIIAGNPQYDPLVRQRRPTADPAAIGKVLVIDQGGYPYGAEGKRQLADALCRIAQYYPEVEFEIKPRYLKSESGRTTHSVFEMLQDYFTEMPENLRFIEKPVILEEVAPAYDAMISTWSTAYLDALVLNIPLLILDGFRSRDMFDVRTKRVDDAYRHLRGSGCVFDVARLETERPEFRYPDPAYVEKEIYHVDREAAGGIVDFMEHTKEHLITRELGCAETIRCDIDEYFRSFDQFRLRETKSAQYAADRVYSFELNRFLQKAVYEDRCMADSLDLSPLIRLYDERRIPAEGDLNAYAAKLRKYFRLKFQEVKEEYFTDPQTAERIREDVILQDFYFKWLYESGRYSTLRGIDWEISARASYDYYLAVSCLADRKGNPYEHICAYCEDVREASCLRTLTEKRAANLLFLFYRKSDKNEFFRYIAEHRCYDVLEMINPLRVSGDPRLTYVSVRHFLDNGRFDEALQLYEAYMRESRRKSENRKGMRGTAKNTLVNLYNTRITALVNRAKRERHR